ISVSDNQIRVDIEVPGVKKKDLKITLQENILTIEGEKKEEKDNEVKNFFRSERNYGKFKRCFTLPVEVNSEFADASFNNGILRISIDKLEEKRHIEKIIELK
ncbi:Hsp20/alpha crystallin family protein, partial [Bacteroidota bacterium]